MDYWDSALLVITVPTPEKSCMPWVTELITFVLKNLKHHPVAKKQKQLGTPVMKQKNQPMIFVQQIFQIP